VRAMSRQIVGPFPFHLQPFSDFFTLAGEPFRGHRKPNTHNSYANKPSFYTAALRCVACSRHSAGLGVVKTAIPAGLLRAPLLLIVRNEQQGGQRQLEKGGLGSFSVCFRPVNQVRARVEVGDISVDQLPFPSVSDALMIQRCNCGDTLTAEFRS